MWVLSRGRMCCDKHFTYCCSAQSAHGSASLDRLAESLPFPQIEAQTMSSWRPRDHHGWQWYRSCGSNFLSHPVVRMNDNRRTHPSPRKGLHCAGTSSNPVTQLSPPSYHRDHALTETVEWEEWCPPPNLSALTSGQPVQTRTSLSRVTSCSGRHTAWKRTE